MDRRAWLLLAAVEARAPARLRGPAVPQSTLPRESDKGLLLLSDLAHSCGPCGRIPGPASAERRSRSGAERPGPGARDRDNRLRGSWPARRRCHANDITDRCTSETRRRAHAGWPAEAEPGGGRRQAAARSATALI